MPYRTVDDLDIKFKRIMSPEAQQVFVEAFNYAWYKKSLPEVRCFMYAWAVLKNRGFRKDDITGIWEKKE